MVYKSLCTKIWRPCVFQKASISQDYILEALWFWRYTQYIRWKKQNLQRKQTAVNTSTNDSVSTFSTISSVYIHINVIGQRSGFVWGNLMTGKSLPIQLPLHWQCSAWLCSSLSLKPVKFKRTWKYSLRVASMALWAKYCLSVSCNEGNVLHSNMLVATFQFADIPFILSYGLIPAAFLRLCPENPLSFRRCPKMLTTDTEVCNWSQSRFFNGFEIV